MSETISDGGVVTIHYTLRLANGEVVDTSDGGEPLVYLHGHGNIIVGLENALTGRAVGDSLEVEVAPADGYGELIEDSRKSVPREVFPDDIEVGMQFGLRGDDDEVLPVWVTEIRDDEIDIELNHPLAGEPLRFAVIDRSHGPRP